MKILVTGVAGQLGYDVINELNKRGIPAIGTDIRQESELINKAKEIDFEDVRQTIELKLDELRNEIKDLDKEKVLKTAKQKGEDIKKKASELVDFAKEKGTPVLHDAAQEVKEKALSVAKEVIEKLEKKED